MALLEVNDIHTYYGAIQALHGVSLHVDEGEIVTLIGANGAGKSTLLNTICGILRPRHGSINLQGEPIHALPPHAIVARGVSQAPEGRRVFGRLNVTENLEMGAFARKDKASIKSDILMMTTEIVVTILWRRIVRNASSMRKMAFRNMCPSPNDTGPAGRRSDFCGRVRAEWNPAGR